MDRVRKIALVLGVASAPTAAIADEPTAPAEQAEASASAAETAVERQGLADARAAVAACALDPTTPATRVIWTWTSAEQIAALRKGGPLLARSRTADGRRSHFDDTVRSHLDGTPLGEHLTRHETRRFGWTHPFATVSGTNTEDYGDQLLRIELEPDALIAVFRPGRAELAFVTAAGDLATEAEFEADPARLAAVYHEAVKAPWADTFGPAPSSVVPHYRYREFVLVGEREVKTIGYGGDAELARLRDDAALLSRISPVLEADAPSAFDVETWASDVWSAWDDSTSGYAAEAALGAAAELRWSQCINLPLEPYLPFQDALDDLIAALEAAAKSQGEPFERSP